ncbi:MAG TPA: hypothetical protein VF794_38235 [Archangium sp.]|jgi:predicted metal-dependent phosphoesterase TrpH|uniref:type I restriction-modification enzyme R subunit C-terminal domain-containing protein n=1 Tax=Archangium sp. TaxID=1872627 RepID=UPI002EDB0D2C
MARISQDQAQERHAFLLDLFRNQPDLSRNEAIEAYKNKFGASLNPKTFNELREQAQQELEGEKAEESSTESETSADDAAARLKTAASSEQTASAQQAAKKPKAKGAGAKNVFVDATPEQLQFLERVVQQLQDSGANNLKIDYATDRWMVLTVDSK